MVVGGFIALEGAGIPLPGEVVLLTAAAAAAQGNLDIAGVVIAAWIGTVVGGTSGYWIGRHGGSAIITRMGRWFGLNAAHEAKARLFFERHGAKTIIIARFVAVLRMIAGILAGVARMPFGVFTACNAIGGFLWAIVFAAIGYLFGRHLPLVEHYLGRGSAGVLVGLLLLAAVIWWLRWRRRTLTRS